MSLSGYFYMWDSPSSDNSSIGCEEIKQHKKKTKSSFRESNPDANHIRNGRYRRVKAYNYSMILYKRWCNCWWNWSWLKLLDHMFYNFPLWNFTPCETQSRPVFSHNFTFWQCLEYKTKHQTFPIGRFFTSDLLSLFTF